MPLVRRHIGAVCAGCKPEGEATSKRQYTGSVERVVPTRIFCLAAGVLLPVMLSCSPTPEPRRTNFEIRAKEGVAKYDPKTGKLQRIDIDRNKNGRIETFSYWDGSRVHRIEIDQDEDGKIDRWEHYNAQNKLDKVGSSSKDDEIEDTWTYPDERGFLARVETDTDRDGMIDKREHFAPRPGEPDGRVLVTVELGLDKDGVASRRLFYRPNGEFDRAESK
jgi:hypothetical protein